MVLKMKFENDPFLPGSRPGGSFDDPKLYEGMLIKTSKKVNVKLIIKEWDNILRIMATLGLKMSSQSTHHVKFT